MEYIWRDMVSMLRYMPYGLVMGIPVAGILLAAANLMRGRRKKGTAAVLPIVLFGIYLSVMLIITFLSRESGGGSVFDLKMFSTWGINDRNNALVVENVLLFVPYGFLGCWAFERTKGFFCCTFVGALTSLAIESLQLVTGRGFFQIDDIVTNTLGAMAGWLIFRILFLRRK